MSHPLQSIGGLASGLDTNTIIQQLMAVEARPKTRMIQQQRVEEARQQALKDIQTRLQNLKDAAQALRDPTVWAKTQTVSTNDATRVTAAATGTAASGGYALTVSGLATAHQVTQGGTFSSVASDDELYVKLGTGATYTVAVAAGDGVTQLADKINATTDVPVVASVVNGKLVLAGKDTGAANTIAVTSRNGDLLRGMTSNALANDLGLATSISAQDASFTVNGTAYTRPSNTVTDVLANVTLSLKGVTSTGNPVTVTVEGFAPDKSAIKGKVQAFVDQYNSTLDFVRGKLDESRVKDPQTDADRAKGVLRGDGDLLSLLGGLRASVGDVVSGLPSSLQQASQVGISTGASTGSGTLSQDAIRGRLSFDGAKLDSALTTDFDSVKSLFTRQGTDYASNGIAWRLDGQLDAQLSPTTGRLSSRLAAEDSLIARLKRDQAALDDRLALRESGLRRQFTAMETALSKAQQQGSWLSGQLAGLGR